MIITTNITMDLSRRGPEQVISAVQDDRYSRNIAMTLTCGSVAWEPPEGTTAQIRYRKPDGTGGNYDALPDGTPAWTIEGSTLTVALAPQVCTVPGRVILTAALVQGETQLHTFVLSIDVQPNPGLQVTSENYYKIAGALPDSGWEPDLYLGTDSEGKVVTKTSPAGGLTLLGTVRPGQYLRVESVDENGNITVEAVDLDAKAAVEYLYGDERLPKVPAEIMAYRYVVMHYFDEGTILVYGYDTEPYTESFTSIFGKTYDRLRTDDGTYRAGNWYSTVPDEWYVTEVGNVTDASLGYHTATLTDIIWANFDIYASDGSLYLAASEPVPVYE